MKHIYNVFFKKNIVMGQTHNGLLWFTILETFAIILASSL